MCLCACLQEHTAALNRFFEWALAQPDVWFVTMRQLLEWMKAPVPASQMADWYKCKPTNLKVPGEQLQYHVVSGVCSVMQYLGPCCSRSSLVQLLCCSRCVSTACLCNECYVSMRAFHIKRMLLTGQQCKA